MTCIGFCLRKPCNCRAILEHQQLYRQEKLQCAKIREAGGECACVERTCTETVEEWNRRIADHSFEKWYERNESSKYLLEKQLLKLKQKALKDLLPHKWRYITITLPKDKQPKEVFKLISSLSKNKPFKEHIYCMEFTGAEMQYHPHIHMVYTKVGKLCHDDKAILRKFKIDKNYLDYSNNIDEKQLKGILMYIMGLKQKDKMEQVNKDIDILKKNNLRKYYYNGEFFSQVISEINASQISETQLQTPSQDPQEE